MTVATSLMMKELFAGSAGRECLVAKPDAGESPIGFRGMGEPDSPPQPAAEGLVAAGNHAAVAAVDQKVVDAPVS